MGAFFDRVMVATATVGTGTISLGAAVRSSSVGDYLTFTEGGVPDGTLVSYFIQDGNNFAEGEGVSGASGSTLTRDANEISWNGSSRTTSKLSLSGSAKVFLSPRAVDLVPPGLVLISSVTIGSAVAAVDITSGIDSKFDEYELHLINFVHIGTATDELTLRVSSDGGATFANGASDYNTVISEGSTASPSQRSFFYLATNVLGNGTDVSSPGYSGLAKFWLPGSTTQRFQISGKGISPINASAARIALFGGQRSATGLVNALRLAFGANNIAAGSMYKLYGVKK